jgi:hypothetical protein
MARKRLNLDLSEEAYGLLQTLAEESDKNMSEILRTGLSLYEVARKAQKEGRSLGVVSGSKVEREILLPR